MFNTGFLPKQKESVMSYPVCMRPQTQIVDQHQVNPVVNQQPSKEEVLIEQGANFVVKTIENIFEKESKACFELLNKGTTMEQLKEQGVILACQPISDSNPNVIIESLFRVKELRKIYVKETSMQQLVEMSKNENSKVAILLNGIYAKAIDKLCKKENSEIRAHLYYFGDQEKGDMAFVSADLLKVVCLRAAQDQLKKI